MQKTESAGATATTSNQVFDGIPGTSATSTSSADSGNSNDQSAAAALNIGRSYGLAVVAGGIFAGFAFML